jgi:hypothetical protein
MYSKNQKINSPQKKIEQLFEAELQPGWSPSPKKIKSTIFIYII